MDYALYVLAFLWAFWAMYVLVMGIYRAHLAKRLTPVTEQQVVLCNHVADLDRKIGSTRFQLDQLQVGRDAFFAMLKQALEEKPEEVVAD